MTTNPIQLLRTARQAIQKQDFVTAIDSLKQLVDHAHDEGDTVAEARHLGNLALLHNRLGMSDDALLLLERALKLAQDQGDKLTEDGLLGNIGNILREVGRYDEAIDYLKRALALAEEIDDVRGRGIWLSNLALVYDDLEQADKAATLHEMSVGIARDLNDQRGLAQRLGNLGNSLMANGQVVQALEHYQEAVEMHRKLGEKPALAVRLGVIGNIYSEMGRVVAQPDQKERYFVLALAHYRETLHLARELADHVTEAILLRGMGNVYGNMANYTEAINNFVAAYRSFEAQGMGDQLPALQESIDMAKRLRDEQQSR